ncbi:DGQHR domain-containing protein [Veillonella sp.]|uniref:DGQHR domain-containing protein n=1 Tax=Veillonella sp. TaxID=1926307 RepID=UPI002913FD40|nr:DGQHR domain-containing protein [Veillonella sp.]MDU3433519.1 DGQHR domain-containing protein [Veillonella sp.]
MINLKYFFIEQPIGKLYLGVLSAEDIDKVAKADTRTTYNQEGIQRRLSETRVREIAKYASGEEAIFPTPIVMSASSKYISFKNQNEMEIDDDRIEADKMYFSIIDGQHRLAGIKEAKSLNRFALPVVIVLDTYVQQDAEIFVTINGNQRPVSKSLIYDLFGLSDKRTVERVCHTIIKSLNRDEDSMIKHKVKMLGYKEAGSNDSTVSQATLVGSLIKLITNNAAEDNRSLEISNKLRELDSNKYIFRDYFIKEQDAIMYKILKNYFNAWTMAKEVVVEKKEKFLYLEKSIGYIASFYLFRAIFLKGKLAHKGTQDYYFDTLSHILKDFKDRFEGKSYSSSESGAKMLFKDLLASAISVQVFDNEFVEIYSKSLGIQNWVAEYEMSI